MIVVIILIPLGIFALADYKTVATDHFTVYYRDGWEVEALKILQVMEDSRPYVEELTGNEVVNTPIVLENMGNEVNGYVNLFGPKIALFAYPPSSDILSNGQDWWQLVGTHEYIHRTQMTVASGLPSLLQKIIGNALYPNVHQPMWITEGITVFGESQLSPYTGRMNGGVYSSIISALAREGKLPSLALANNFNRSTPQAHYYVLGGSFFSFLAERYGPQKFRDMFALQGGSLRTYLSTFLPVLSINTYYKQIYGKSLDALWAEWQAWETDNAQALPQGQLTFDGWEKDNLCLYKGDLYYTQEGQDKTGPSSQFSYNHIVRLVDPQGACRKEVIHSQYTGYPAGFQLAGDYLYYSRAELHRGYDNNENDGWGSETEIWRKIPGTDWNEKLFEGQIRAFRVLADGTILIVKDDLTYQTNTIEHYDMSGNCLSEPLQVRRLIGNIRQSGDRIFVTAKPKWFNTAIFELDLHSGTLTELTASPYSHSLVSADENSLIFDATYNGLMASYRLDLHSGETYKLCEYSGIRNAQIDSDGNLYVISVVSAGNEIFREEATESVFTPENRGLLSAAMRTPLAGQQRIGEYEVTRAGYAGNLRHLIVPRIARLPYLAGSVDSLTVGIMLMGQDIVGDIPWWSTIFEYDLYSQKAGLSVELTNKLLRPLIQDISYSSFKGGSLGLSNNIELLRRANYGLTTLWTGLSIRTEDAFKRKLWIPFVTANFAWERGRLAVNNALLYEATEFWASDRDRLGWHGRLNMRLSLDESTELRTELMVAYDPDANKDEVFSTTRGYDSRWRTNQGLTACFSIYKPLLQVRNAIWTPQVYMEDICGGLIFDAALPYGDGQDELRYASGVELIGEFVFASRASIDLGLRYTINKDSKGSFGLILGTGF